MSRQILNHGIDLTVGNTDYRGGDENALLPGQNNEEETLFREVEDPGKLTVYSNRTLLLF